MLFRGGNTPIQNWWTLPDRLTAQETLLYAAQHTVAIIKSQDLMIPSKIYQKLH